MKKVKAFFYIFFKSIIPNYSYYTKILKIRFNFSFKYFVFLIVFLNFLFWLSLVYRYSPQKIKFWLNNINSVLINFPSDLNVFIEKGYLISSYDRPYFLWLNDYKGRIRLFLVIDESGTAEKIDQYKTRVLLTKTDLFIKLRDKIERIPLIYFDKFFINKEILSSFALLISSLNNNFFYLYYFFIFALIFILMTAFSLIVNFFYLFLASLLVFIFLRLLKKEEKHRLKKVFQIGCHAATLPIFLDYFIFSFVDFLPIKIQLTIKPITFPLIFLFFLILFIAFGIYEAYAYNYTNKDYRHKQHHLRNK